MRGNDDCRGNQVFWTIPATMSGNHSSDARSRHESLSGGSGLLGPSCQPSDTSPPWPEQSQVLVSHSTWSSALCEIETEIISGFGEQRTGSGRCGSVASPKDFRKHILLLFAGITSSHTPRMFASGCNVLCGVSPADRSADSSKLVTPACEARSAALR